MTPVFTCLMHNKEVFSLTHKKGPCYGGKKILTFFPSIVSGTSPLAILCARPSAIAVFPTPGSPMRQGLFFVRRPKIWVTRSICCCLPTTGSSLPWRGNKLTLGFRTHVSVQQTTPNHKSQ